MHRILLFICVCLGLASADSPTILGLNITGGSTNAANCFPALGFQMPSELPPNSELSSWWCDPADEYAFVGFSYEVTACELPMFDCPPS
jgi:hypothetical protein